MIEHQKINVARHSMTIQGRVRVKVVDSKTGLIKRDCGWQKNLILNAGFEGLASYSGPALTTYGVCGTGTTPTQDDSGTTTAAQSGTTVTLTGGSYVFPADCAGSIIKWDAPGGEEARIVSYTSGTQVTVQNTATVSDALFTVYRAGQTLLSAEISPTKRTNNYLPGTGNSETTWTAASGIQKNRRTYDFAAETGSVTYTEVGVARLITVNTTLFARVLLASPLSLVSGDVLRLVYEMQFNLTPYEPRAAAPTVTGWGTIDGDEMCESFGLHGISSSTGGESLSTYHIIEPSDTGHILISNSTTALAANPGTGNPPTNRAGTLSARKTATNAASGTGTLQMTMTKSVTFGTTEGNITGIRSLALHYWSSGTTYYINHAFLMDSAQDKTNTKTLALSWSVVWSRVLS